ncbi:MAG TPA: hypothetical protein DEO86_15535, partial [Colwellia sp.]|nr:hypothetical protein [Colwellia sp.]
MKIKNKHLRKLHIYCSLICCTLLFVFSITGISLNHRMMFEAEPKQSTSQYVIRSEDAHSIQLLLRELDLALDAKELEQLILNKELSSPSPGKRLELYIEEQQLFIE